MAGTYQTLALAILENIGLGWKSWPIVKHASLLRLGVNYGGKKIVNRL
jgi:hypothetical protein